MILPKKPTQHTKTCLLNTFLTWVFLVIEYWTLRLCPLIFKASWKTEESQKNISRKQSLKSKTTRMDELLIWIAQNSPDCILMALRPGTAALVVVSTPHWTPASMKRFPQTHAVSSLHFLSSVCSPHVWPYDTESRSVLCEQERADNWLKVYYFPETWGRTHLPACISLRHPSNPMSGRLHIRSPSTLLLAENGQKTPKVQFTLHTFDAFGYKNSIWAATHLLFVILPENMVCEPFHTWHSTSWGDCSYCFSLST